MFNGITWLSSGQIFKKVFRFSKSYLFCFLGEALNGMLDDERIIYAIVASISLLCISEICSNTYVIVFFLFYIITIEEECCFGDRVVCVFRGVLPFFYDYGVLVAGWFCIYLCC